MSKQVSANERSTALHKVRRVTAMAAGGAALSAAVLGGLVASEIPGGTASAAKATSPSATSSVATTRSTSASSTGGSTATTAPKSTSSATTVVSGGSG